MSSPAPLAEDVLSALPAGVLVVDRAGLVRRLNPAGSMILGLHAPAGGRPVVDVLAPLETLLEVGDRRRQLTYVRPDGDTLQIGYSGAPCREGHVILFRDVSSLTEARSAREQNLRVQTISEVMPTLLHELRNPLAAMTSAVELLIEETRPGELRSELESILIEGRRMDLGFQGIGMVGRSLCSPRQQPVAPAVHEVVRVMRAPASRAGVIVRLDCDRMPLLPLNAAVVRAMLYNLINNSITACRKGDEIRVKAGLLEDDTIFSMSVHDTGVGMDEAVLARCTELFFTTRSHGSGIGLSMCRWAVEEAGGLCTVLSTAGRGTRVVIEVPVPDREEELR